MKSEPVISTAVPPDGGPATGTKPVTAGAATYVKDAADAPVPSGVVTATGPDVPVAAAAVVAVMLVGLSTVKAAASTPAMLTDWTFTNSVPVIVTGVPPSGEPVAGAKPVTVGATWSTPVSSAARAVASSLLPDGPGPPGRGMRAWPR
ncbi:hypothetical protein E4N63_29260 [Streptomyces sp. MNU89]|nr:hypothetical protein [Streptomyces sp. MNU89]MCC9742907.1 hypothetical protein [Streptomyces sp. MNU89]